MTLTGWIPFLTLLWSINVTHDSQQSAAAFIQHSAFSHFARIFTVCVCLFEGGSHVEVYPQKSKAIQCMVNEGTNSFSCLCPFRHLPPSHTHTHSDMLATCFKVIFSHSFENYWMKLWFSLSGPTLNEIQWIKWSVVWGMGGVLYLFLDGDSEEADRKRRRQKRVRHATKVTIWKWTGVAIWLCRVRGCDTVTLLSKKAKSKSNLYLQELSLSLHTLILKCFCFSCRFGANFLKALPVATLLCLQ